jgi:hypothetical protein
VMHTYVVSFCHVPYVYLFSLKNNDDNKTTNMWIVVSVESAARIGA